MTLTECFISQCRASSVLLKCDSPSFKDITNHNGKLGIEGVLDFDSFKLHINYYEKGSAASPQQTIWLTFVLSCDETLPFSIYDILSYTEPQNFNCYTFSYVDSETLLSDCFKELNDILSRLVPRLQDILNNGIEKNKLILSQRNNINKFYNDDVLESGEMIGPSADKIINMMIKTFHDSELEAAVSGGQALFYCGKEDKAIKKLEKAKFKTQYQLNLLAYLKNGGTAKNISPTAKNASIHKGARRQSGGAVGILKFILYALAFDIAISLILGLLFYVILKISFKGSILYMGFWENLMVIPSFSIALSVALAFQYKKYRDKKRGLNKNDVQIPETAQSADKMLKYLTIGAETLALIGLITSVNSTVVFYENSFKYSQEDFPLSQTQCKYSAVDFVGIVGDKGNNLADRESYIVIRTKSGSTLNLYNSTWLSAEDFKSHTKFLQDKNIDIKEFKTYEDYESYK